MKKTATYKKYDYVRVNNSVAQITEVRKGTEIMPPFYQIDGKWYEAKELQPFTLATYPPTEDQMRAIKKAYPLFSKDNIKIVKDGKRNFIFHYSKNEQHGYMRCVNEDITPISIKKVYSLCVY